MFKNLLFTMSAAGSIVVVFYILLYPITKGCFSPKWRYCMLKMAIVFYLIPFPYYKYRILDVIHIFSPSMYEILRDPVEENISAEYTIVINKSEILMSQKVKIIFGCIFVSGIITLFILLWHLVRYVRIRKLCLEHAEIINKAEWKRICENTKEELKIRRKVKLVCSEYCKFPLTGGIFSPIILLPMEDEIEESVYETVIRHELVHIKHHDVLIKCLGLLVIGVHWFNPISYYLYYELLNISEIYCDSIVLKNKEEDDYKKYGELILQFALNKYSISNNRYYVGIINSSSKAVYKRRFQEMKMKRKTDRTVLAFILMLCVCVIAGGTVFAYDPPGNMLGDDDEMTLEFVVTEGGVEIGGEYLPYDYFYTDIDGNTFELKDDNIAGKSSCTHNYNIPVEVTKHERNGKGGCTIIYWNALKCSGCGTIKRTSIKNELSYKTCPH